MGPVSDYVVGEAVEKGVIGNQTIAYFMARTYLFLIACGINEASLGHYLNHCMHLFQN